MDTELDLEPLRKTYSGRGSRPHRPDLLLKLMLFEHHRGRFQPIQWHEDLQENVAVRWLTCGLQALLGRDKQDVFRPVYNVQVLTDVKTDLVLAYDVSASPSGSGARTVQRQPDEELIEQLKEWMQTPQAKLLYAMRCRTVERRFADLKTHRNFQRMSGQTPERARAQTGLTILAHNLVTLAALRDAKSLPHPVEIPAKTTA